MSAPAWAMRARRPSVSLAVIRSAALPLYALLVAVAAFFVVPLVWLLLAPSKSSTEELNAHPLGFSSAANYAHAWSHLMTYATNDSLVLIWGLNSLIYSVSAVVLASLFGIPAGYALACFSFPGRRVVLFATILAMIVPQNALVLPLFLELSRLHLIGSRFALILPSGFFPLGVILSYIYFSSHFPRQLLGAARLDGCGEFGAFFRIALPMARHVFPLIAFFAFWASWVNYFLPSVVLSDQRTFSLPVGIVNITQATNVIVPNLVGGAGVWPIGRPEIALVGLLWSCPS